MWSQHSLHPSFFLSVTTAITSILFYLSFSLVCFLPPNQSFAGVVRVEPRASSMRGKCSATELHPDSGSQVNERLSTVLFHCSKVAVKIYFQKFTFLPLTFKILCYLISTCCFQTWILYPSPAVTPAVVKSDSIWFPESVSSFLPPSDSFCSFAGNVHSSSHDACVQILSVL